MDFHKTNNPLHIMQLFGHRNTQLINFENGDYHSATAKTLEETTKLIEAGFEYACTPDNKTLLRR